MATLNIAVHAVIGQISIQVPFKTIVYAIANAIASVVQM